MFRRVGNNPLDHALPRGSWSVFVSFFVAGGGYLDEYELVKGAEGRIMWQGQAALGIVSTKEQGRLKI